jgi:ABC-type multidrug transport system permease subunit
MEWYEYLKDKWNLDVIIIVIVFLSGFFQEKYLSKFVWVKDGRFNASLKTLAVSLIASSIYILLIHNEAKRASETGVALIPWAKYFIGYFAATSLYDLGIRPIRKWITKKLGEPETNNTNN